MSVAFLPLLTSSGQAPTFSVIHVFTGGADGALPGAGLIRDAAGNLYGTAPDGGIHAGSCVYSGCGVVFKLDRAGALTVLHSFDGGAGGGNPLAGLVRDVAGNLYGTTSYGGIFGRSCQSPGCGVVFKLDPAGNETVLYRFTGATGSYPSPGGGLVRDASGNLYGTTALGGNIGGACGQYGCGVLFKVNPTGNETVLHAFSGVDGSSPTGGLIQDPDGNLYGTSQGGGTGIGLAFKFDSSGNETVLHTFTGVPDGAVPTAGLWRDAAGNLYGTTYGGGIVSQSCSYLFGCGVAFEIDAAGNETVLYTFKGGTDGENPYAGLLRDLVGNLYGATQYGGNNACPAGCGAIFKIGQNGVETTLHDFSGVDGGNPEGRLLLNKGYLYGTAQNGTGGAHAGVVYGLSLR
jgi:uncharacterized repeat protein (TIGR03803 family)